MKKEGGLVTIRFSRVTPVEFFNIIKDDTDCLRFAAYCFAHGFCEQFHSLRFSGFVASSIPFDFYPRHINSPKNNIVDAL